jgi:hypothetical protein
LVNWLSCRNFDRRRGWGKSSSHCGWCGEWCGMVSGRVVFYFFFDVISMKLLEKKIRSVWIKAVGERMVGGRYVCSMGCLGGVVKTK